MSLLNSISLRDRRGQSLFRLIATLLVAILAFHFVPNVGSVQVFAEDEHSTHADHDPTHRFAGDMQSDPMEFRSDGAIFSLIVFLLLLAVLYAFAWKPITQGLEKRELTIASHIAEAKRANEEGAAMLREYERKLSAAQTEAQEVLVQARKDAESAGQRIVAAAQDEATRQRDRALADIESAKQAALSELTNRSTDIAFNLARRVIGRELKPGDHDRLIQDALSGMPSRN